MRKDSTQIFWHICMLVGIFRLSIIRCLYQNKPLILVHFWTCSCHDKLHLAQNSESATDMTIGSVKFNIASCNANHSKSHNYQPLEIRFAAKCVWSQVQIARIQPSWCLQVTTNGAKLQKEIAQLPTDCWTFHFIFQRKQQLDQSLNADFPCTRLLPSMLS